MSDTVLVYIISLGIVGAGVGWIVAGTYSTTSELCIAIGGKSTTAKLFAEVGVPVYDADAIVHQLYPRLARSPGQRLDLLGHAVPERALLLA
jgi:hypothetical protein